MSNQLLEQYVKAHSAFHGFMTELGERIREQRGQTTVEWLVLMVGIIALGGAFASSGLLQDAADEVYDTFDYLVDKVGKI
jgi:di/tricarboxylate transporter